MELSELTEVKKISELGKLILELEKFFEKYPSDSYSLEGLIPEQTESIKKVLPKHYKTKLIASKRAYINGDKSNSITGFTKRKDTLIIKYDLGHN